MQSRSWAVSACHERPPRQSRSRAVSACHERPARQSRSQAVSACHERPPRQSRSRVVSSQPRAPSLHHTAVPPANQSRSQRFPAQPVSLAASLARPVCVFPASPTPPSPQPASYARSAPPAGVARPVCSATKWKSLLISVVTASRRLKRKPKAEPKHQRCFWEKQNHWVDRIAHVLLSAATYGALLGTL